MDELAELTQTVAELEHEVEALRSLVEAMRGAWRVTHVVGRVDLWEARVVDGLQIRTGTVTTEGGDVYSFRTAAASDPPIPGVDPYWIDFHIEHVVTDFPIESSLPD